MDYVKQSKLSKDAKILDIGCGGGDMVFALRGLGYKTWGSDNTQAMIDRAQMKAKQQKRSNQGEFVLADAEKLPFEAETFDCITCAGVTGYVINLDEAYKEIKRVLKKDGFAIITFRNKRELCNVIDVTYNAYVLIKKCAKYLLHINNDAKWEILIEVIYRTFSTWQVRKELRRNGFRLLADHGAGYGPLKVFRYKILPNLLLPFFIWLEGKVNKVRILGIFKNYPMHYITYLKNDN